jgi:hypothetical protein
MYLEWRSFVWRTTSSKPETLEAANTRQDAIKTKGVIFAPGALLAAADKKQQQFLALQTRSKG